MFFERKYRWMKLDIATDECRQPEGGIMEVMIEGRPVCLVSWNEKWYAFSGTCPHAGAPLAKGELDPRGIVICPRHGYSFNFRNGHNTSGEGYRLSCWPVEKREDGLYIGFRE